MTNWLQRFLRRKKTRALKREILSKVRDVPAATSIPDFERRMAENVDRCLQIIEWLSLDRGSALEILDIGTGYGFLPYICRADGHSTQQSNYWSPDPYGTNTDHPSHTEASDVFRQAHERLGLTAIHLGINARTPMPPLDRRVDVVVAMGTMFNMDWTIDDYVFWFEDLWRSALRPDRPGRIALISNNFDGVANAGLGWTNFIRDSAAIQALPMVSGLDISGFKALLHTRPCQKS